MAQGMGHLDGRRFWLLAIPSYAGTAVLAYVVGIFVREELWFRRLQRTRRP